MKRRKTASFIIPEAVPISCPGLEGVGGKERQRLCSPDSREEKTVVVNENNSAAIYH